MKEKLALVIAALVISAMGVLSPATTPIVAATEPTVTLTPTDIRDNAYVLFTLTVTNPSDSENIENILIMDQTTGVSTKFSGGIFGENVAENIDNVADNLIEAGNLLGQVADNLEQALVKFKATGDALIEAANWLENAGDTIKSVDNYSGGAYLMLAASDLSDAAAALKVVPENLRLVRAKLKASALNLSTAAVYMIYAYENVHDNLIAAANALDNYCAENFIGAFENASDNRTGLYQVGTSIMWAGKAMTDFWVNPLIDVGGHMLENAGLKILQAADNLKMAADNLENAGLRLRDIKDNLLNNAVGFPLMVNKYGVAEYYDNYLNSKFLENIDNAGAALENSEDAESEQGVENLLVAGSFLENAAKCQICPEAWLGPELASNIIGYYGELVSNTVRYWIGIAGENIGYSDNVNLTAAASALDNAGARLIAAGNKLKVTKAKLSPTTGWGAETGGMAGTNGILFMSIDNDNHIAPDTSKTFTFLWRAPDIGVLENHTIWVYTYDNDNNVLTDDNFTISVDGKAPGLDVFTVTQDGVKDYMGNAVDNLIGQVYDNNKATITITVEEELQAMGTIRIENYKVGGENLVLSMSDFTTTDNKTFTYDIYTTDWVDNAENALVKIVGPWATDIYGTENESTATCCFNVDMRAPIQIENGLIQFRNLSSWKKPGTDNEYHVTTLLRWTITGRAEDNENVVGQTSGNADNDVWAMTTVYVNGTPLTMSRLPDDNWTTTGDLVEGVNRIRVVTVDRVGLQIENELENVFIDNTKPTVEFVSVSGLTWSDNTLRINDNTPTIRLKIYDSGMGIPRDNVRVVLDNDDNLINNTEIGNLENNGVWDNGAATGDYNFENSYDNIVNYEVKGLATGWWYIHVQVSDNLHENDNYVQRFYIDVTAPTAPATANMSSTLTAGTLASPTTTNLSSVTITGTGVADDTLKVYTTTDGVTWTEQTTYETTVNTAGEWSVTISLTSGVNTGIAFTLIDSAQNESTRTTWGYVISDASAPTVTITSPATGTSTDQTSIVVSGTVAKDNWEEYTDLASSVQVGSASAGGLTIGSDGSFTVSAALSEGTNTITISVTDESGNTSSAVVSVTRTVTPWATYAIIIVIVAMILAAIAIFRKK